MKVVCTNDKQLPPGAEVVLGIEYEVAESFKNNFDEIVYLVKGVNNEGRTRFGLPWIGYKATRFAKLDSIEEKEVEYNFALN